MEPVTRIFSDEDALFRGCARRVAEIADAAIGARGAFHLALSGGATPRGLHRQLAAPGAPPIDWSRTHIWFGDERCVPPDHADSNFRMARETLLDLLPVPPAQVHRMRGEDEPAAAAAAYAALLEKELADDGGPPHLDLVLLGIGPDGHVASLFPDTDILTRRDTLAAAVHVEKLSAWRISLTLPAINAARHVIVLICGTKKAEVVRQALDHEAGRSLPVRRLAPAGTLEWFLDRLAAEPLAAEPGA